MQTQNPCLSKTLNLPLLVVVPPSSSSSFFNPHHQPIHSIEPSFTIQKSLQISCKNPAPNSCRQNATRRLDFRTFAGRSKGNTGGNGSGFVDANAHLLREARREARKRNKKYVEGLFYRLKNPHKNYPDNFTEDELEMMGLGYDRMVRFMEQDDPNLKHPHDWYKYGEFGPYSWRGVVLGEPIRGRFTDECVTMMGEVRNLEEWEKIEQFEMARDFQTWLDKLNPDVRLRYFWVFVRHPRWRVSELPWQQWTLVSEVVLEAGDQRLDKWNLMGRLGNKSRSMITQCAAWMRPDIIYVKRPVFQCRFEPQDNFFQALTPFLDPETEKDYLFELVNDEGRLEFCTYYGGLCRLVKVSQKAFVDDVANAFEKLSDEKKSKCLEFLLSNHPVQILHPYTQEWKAKLEEMELGCDAPDEDDGDRGSIDGKGEIIDWIEDDGRSDLEEDEDDDDAILDADVDNDEELGIREDEEELSPEENPNYWEEEFKKALNSNEAMENFAKRSMEAKERQFGKQQAREMEVRANEDGDELVMRSQRAKVKPEEWRSLGYGPFRKRVKKSKAPPGQFLRAAVRPFTYRNLVKEIALTRHAILDGEVVTKK
ncbi:OLC1v1023247C1 [Oldenlandia corymbosa var. corymbosa]|uniref:OLC1v1023247C1 n=1 Tax=Oldenlandia corymbosa var. corymbosa TaxID=529605 RepID=A0AAV1BZI6_OLDCO|nr:OLC1v1023247C1 [Oldenlandia corymbosa var. corymbosa]